ncbi:MAG: radical SAM protein, partial [Planctomycetes bacterium]|nr:radical SAM protein [Planctomycetota bacterium]
MNLTILYRGPLSSRNYDCHYCPFGKHQESSEELAADRAALSRFVRRVEELSEITLSIFFTPWGEALVRRSYQQALATLSRLPHVRRVAIQTNLSCPLNWLDECDISKIGLWCTWHPSQVGRPEFIQQCHELSRRGVSYSAGMVGLHEDFGEMARLREDLPEGTYFWVNAYKDQPDYYSPEEVDWLESLDPLFRTNTIRHPSRGRSCRAGATAMTVDGEGTMRRCHFVREPIGNFYDDNFTESLAERPCPNDTCGCHIGYVHLDELQLYPVYGAGLLERVPSLRNGPETTSPFNREPAASAADG